MKFDYTPKIDPTLFIANRQGEWFETVCYCPTCRANGIKVYTISNGKREKCLICEPGRKKRDNKEPVIYMSTPMRERIISLCPATIETLYERLPNKSHFIDKAIRVMEHHKQIEIIDGLIHPID